MRLRFMFHYCSFPERCPETQHSSTRSPTPEKRGLRPQQKQHYRRQRLIQPHCFWRGGQV